MLWFSDFLESKRFIKDVRPKGKKLEYSVKVHIP